MNWAVPAWLGLVATLLLILGVLTPWASYGRDITGITYLAHSGLEPSLASAWSLVGLLVLLTGGSALLNRRPRRWAAILPVLPALLLWLALVGFTRDVRDIRAYLHTEGSVHGISNAITRSVTEPIAVLHYGWGIFLVIAAAALITIAALGAVVGGKSPLGLDR